MYNIFTHLNLSLPLDNPVLIFALILFIILFAPIILNKLRIPHLIGLIIAGAIIGPHGFNVLARDNSIILFSTVGILYIMFLAGLEIDRSDFKKNSWRSLLFGFYTFTIPLGLGFLTSRYILEFSLLSSILLASMFATHTLIAYPMVSRMGVAKNRAVTIAVGGTVITDTLALLVLAAVAGLATGALADNFWLRLSASFFLFAAIVIFMFPIIARWFFKQFDDNITQYIFVLGMLFLAAFLAEAAGVEPIIGAFLAGLSLNRLIPNTSPLMNRIAFVGNALFIPFFLIGVGMLVDYQVFIQDLETLKVAGIMVTVALISKFAAAWLTQKSFRFSADERRLIFGLSSAHAAATLAIILVGYNIILNQAEIDAAALVGETIAPVRLLSDSVLNGTIIIILMTCTIASIFAQRGAKNIAVSQANDEPKEDIEERIMIPLRDVDHAAEMVDLCVTIKSKTKRQGLYALYVIPNDMEGNNAEKNAKKILDRAAVTAAATDNHLIELLRYDSNVANAITGVVREQRISDLILGMHSSCGLGDSPLGNLIDGVLTNCNTTTLIYRAVQPLATVRRYLIIVPDKAERELGFAFWLLKVWNIGRNTGAKLVFYASKNTIVYLQKIQRKHPVNAEFNEFDNWDDFLILSREVKPDDNLLVVLSRRSHPSYNDNMAKIPLFLNKYFHANGFILIYPMQSGVSEREMVDFTNSAVLHASQGTVVEDIERTIGRLFKWK
ncbi:MAG: cation:proton antiporter [Bacteroidales bacterium]|nr:cation:proton antiporter [Bacteroidales bacterium]MCL2133812.1 cation:proton antiporter [Bacteroidales bacterium]